MDFVRPVASRTGSQGSELSSMNLLSAIPDLLHGTRYLSTCRQLLTLTLSSVYLKLTYLLQLINFVIAFIVLVLMTMWCLLDYCVSGHKSLLYVCNYLLYYLILSLGFPFSAKPSCRFSTNHISADSRNKIKIRMNDCEWMSMRWQN